MKKLRLDLENIQVETFGLQPATFDSVGTVQGRQETTHPLIATCIEGGCVTYNPDNMCTADCTGVGVECYTCDQQYYACTGENPCTGAAACTFNECSGG